MGIKNACRVVDLRTGQDVIHIPDLVAVLSNDSGGQVSSTALLELQEGEEIAVEGEKVLLQKIPMERNEREGSPFCSV